jgi:TetR/AcrR family tetracycline transcriptional repressor
MARRRIDRNRLDRQTVVRSALLLLEKVGLDGLTLRRLARDLHVQAPALYWHFKNKQELLDEMATTVLIDNLPHMLPNEARTWPLLAARFGKGLRQALLRYRDGAKMFSGTYLTDKTVFASMESALHKLTEAGLSLREAVCAMGTIYCYAVGFTIEEQAVYPHSGKRSKQYDPAKRAARIDRRRFPLALVAGKEIFTGFDRRFEEGLQLIIRGLRPRG